MSVYLPENIAPFEWSRRLRSSLAGIPFLTVQDMVALMDGEPELCGHRDLAIAEWDLRTCGYRKKTVSLWGLRPIFTRYVREEIWPEDAIVFDQLCKRE